MTDKSNEGIGFERAEKLWVILELSDWMTEENIDKFRAEFKLARYITKTVGHLKGNIFFVCCISCTVLEKLTTACSLKLGLSQGTHTTITSPKVKMLVCNHCSIKYTKMLYMLFLESENYTLRTLDDLLCKIGKSFIMRNSAVQADIEKLQSSVQDFCKRIGQMFSLSPSYYSIVEVIFGLHNIIFSKVRVVY